MLNKMKWSTQAIALPPAIQVTLFPTFVEVADELALGWEEAFAELPHVEARLLPRQLQAIRRLDDYMLSISGQENGHLWTMEALTSSKEWDLLRALANALLEQMGWPKTKPPDTDALYILDTGQLF